MQYAQRIVDLFDKAALAAVETVQSRGIEATQTKEVTDQQKNENPTGKVIPFECSSLRRDRAGHLLEAVADGAHEPLEGGIQFLEDVVVLCGKGLDEGALGKHVHERLCKDFVGCIVIGQIIAAVLVFTAKLLLCLNFTPRKRSGETTVSPLRFISPSVSDTSFLQRRALRWQE